MKSYRKITMDIEKVKSAQSQEEARGYAVQWQHWMNNQNISWGEILEWENTFRALATKFDLVEEFTENGII